MSIFNDIEEARNFLEAGDVFYETRKGHEEWNREHPEGHKYHEDDDDETRMLNMNDTFGWALAYSELVPDDKMIEVATLFWRYGHHGLTYWCAELQGWEKSEFHDITRGIQFVRMEEKLRKDVPNTDKRAYKKLKYKLG